MDEIEPGAEGRADPKERAKAQNVHCDERDKSETKSCRLSPPGCGKGEHRGHKENVGLHRVATLDDLHRKRSTHDAVAGRGYVVIEHRKGRRRDVGVHAQPR
jgi:hypothetical protein